MALRIAGMAPDAGSLHAQVAGLTPGWLVLPRRALGAPGELAVTIGYVLLNPNHGIALLDFVPARRTPDAVGRLQRMLDTMQFHSIFGGYPPIIYLHVESDDLIDLEQTLRWAFAAEPPLNLPGGQSWLGSPLRLLSEMAPMPAAEPVPVPRPMARTARADEPGAMAWQPHTGRWRPAFYGAMLGCGVLLGLLGFRHVEPLLGLLDTAKPQPAPVTVVAQAEAAAANPSSGWSDVGQGDGSDEPAALIIEAATQQPEPLFAPSPRPAQDVQPTLPAAMPTPVGPPPYRLPDPVLAPQLVSLPAPVTVPGPAAARPMASRPLSEAMLASLLRRGDQMLELDDLSAARALYRRAAEGGSALAAAALAATWDPTLMSPHTTSADLGKALEWYRLAAGLGDAAAVHAITRLEAAVQP